MPDALFAEVRWHFSEQELVDLTLAVVAINGWNRLAISFRPEVGSDRPRAAAAGEERAPCERATVLGRAMGYRLAALRRTAIVTHAARDSSFPGEWENAGLQPMSHIADAEALVHEFDRHRPALFGLAYRMLGSAMDAEDILQEAFLRWQQSPHYYEVQSPRAFPLTIVTRLCLDALRAARARREHYVGPWLPEPLVQAEAADPLDQAENVDTLSFAFLLLLERLTPLERAVFILHEVFGYSYDEVAGMIGSNGPHCRQLGHRARQRLAAERPRFRADPAQAAQAARAFARACAAGDLQGLLALFAHDIALWTDGGGKARAARNIVHGADRVARFFVGIMRKVGHLMTVEHASVNGQPGLLVWIDDRINRVYTFDLDAHGRIQAIYCVLNPDKLRGIARGGPAAPG